MPSNNHSPLHEDAFIKPIKRPSTLPLHGETPAETTYRNFLRSQARPRVIIATCIVVITTIVLLALTVCR
jgi:hypothetical protein